MTPHRLAVLAAMAITQAACGGGDSSVQIVLVDETRTLAETVQISYPLAIGTYRAEITASRNGVAVLWVGGSSCPAAVETRSYTATCVIDTIGGLSLANPTLLGVPGDEVVKIRITRL